MDGWTGVKTCCPFHHSSNGGGIKRRLKYDYLNEMELLLSSNSYSKSRELWTEWVWLLNELQHEQRCLQSICRQQFSLCIQISRQIFQLYPLTIILLLFLHENMHSVGLGGSVGYPSDWWSGVCRFDPRQVGNILSWRLIMKYFLRSYSPFHWFKKGSGQFLEKECAQYWLTA